MSILAVGPLSGKYKIKQHKLTPLLKCFAGNQLLSTFNGKTISFHFISSKLLPVLTVFGAIGQAVNALLVVVGAP